MYCKYVLCTLFRSIGKKLLLCCAKCYCVVLTGGYAEPDGRVKSLPISASVSGDLGHLHLSSDVDDMSATMVRSQEMLDLTGDVSRFFKAFVDLNRVGYTSDGHHLHYEIC